MGITLGATRGGTLAALGAALSRSTPWDGSRASDASARVAAAIAIARSTIVGVNGTPAVAASTISGTVTNDFGDPPRV